ncbi:DNA alkylation repair protein [Aliagarivorans taiwanensis]|uniref:DNA alkylation repair protein n=1 Tax=Aliagarivorans taiwanensis TaxID=561966 RepID=UPI0003FD5AB1|nr:DNA alkylation repair protein [Aliagarivorans taiwanensis]
MSAIQQACQALEQYIEPEKAAHYPKFFQAQAGGYGEGDCFLGVRVPSIRLVAKHCPLTITDSAQLLESQWHEQRQLALVNLVSLFKQGSAEERERIIAVYWDKRRRVNNWDLVDCSCPYILGPYVWTHQDIALLERFASDPLLWSQRMAMVSCWHYIRQGDSALTMQLAERFKHHPHPLMHKAVGWMLRELAKRDQASVEAFLKANLSSLPRELLRYSIERFPETLRKAYLSGAILS